MNDSLVIKSEQNKTLKFNEDFLIEANLPFNKINKNKISKYLKDGGIPIITGFQGVNNENRCHSR